MLFKRVSHCVLLCVSVFFSSMLSATQLSHYQIVINDFDKSEFKVDATLVISDISTEPLTFVLNQSAIISSVTLGQKQLEFTFDKQGKSPSIYIEKGRELVINLPGSQKESFDLTISYTLNKKAVNYLSDAHFEAGIYTAWYPLNFDYGKFTFDVWLKDQGNNRFAVNGNSQQQADGWHLSNANADVDLVLLASPSLETRQFEEMGNRVILISLADNSALFSQLESQIKHILALFNQRFSLLQNGNGQYQFVLVPRASGPSYSRNQFAVLTYHAKRTEQNLVSTLAHEIAHFWWHKAAKDNWQDWLNEGFAEYASLLAMKSIYGDAVLQQGLAKKQDKSKNTPAIRGLARNSNQAQSVFYDKGALLFHNVRQEVGDEAFFAWLTEVYQKDIATTQALLSLSKTHLTEAGYKTLEKGLSE